MKILHLSFHQGCQNDIQYISEKLGFELEFMTFTDGVTKNNEIYNITKERAQIAWDNYKDYYNKFDCIITSDTAPICRVFLQNNWSKKLIIWICNRFDYCHGSNSGFPDEGYYELIRSVKNRKNVEIIGYTDFENYYANYIRNCDIGFNIIKPIGVLSINNQNYTSTIVENKEETFFVGPYHNDNIMMDLASKLKELNIPVYQGRYNGPKDLSEFKGIVHIPYAWSNLALFEAINLGIIYFIPSFEFFKELKKNKDFFWSPPYREEVLGLSEWYNSFYKDVIIYFDSYSDLIDKTKNINYIDKKNKMRKLGEKFKKNKLEKWKNIII